MPINARTALIMVVMTIATNALAAAPAPIQSYDGYKSWLVVCDNTLACVTKGFVDGNSQGAEIRIDREAGPKGKVSATIRAPRKFGLPDVKLDGSPLDLSADAWEVTSSVDETSFASDDLGAVRVLIQRLRNGAKVTLGGDAEVPLDGFAAAMLRLDERQGRIGGVTALFSPGDAPSSRVPAAPPLPKIVAHPISLALKPGEEKRLIASVRASQKAIFEKEECESKPIAMDAEAHLLDAGRAIVLLPCLMGAYQGSSLAFIASRDGRSAQRLIAPTPYRGEDPKEAGAAYFTEASFDPATGTLSTAAKGRGLADCGMSASWIWDGESFRLSDMTLQQACGGMEPGDWPTIFRSSQ